MLERQSWGTMSKVGGWVVMHKDQTHLISSWKASTGKGLLWRCVIGAFHHQMVILEEIRIFLVLVFFHADLAIKCCRPRKVAHGGGMERYWSQEPYKALKQNYWLPINSKQARKLLCWSSTNISFFLCIDSRIFFHELHTGLILISK